MSLTCKIGRKGLKLQGQANALNKAKKGTVGAQAQTLIPPSQDR